MCLNINLFHFQDEILEGLQLLVLFSSEATYTQALVLLVFSKLYMFIVVQSLSHVQLFATLWTAARQASLSFGISWSLLKLMSIESVMQPSHPLSSASPPAFSLSQNWGLFQ